MPSSGRCGVVRASAGRRGRGRVRLRVQAVARRGGRRAARSPTSSPRRARARRPGRGRSRRTAWSTRPKRSLDPAAGLWRGLDAAGARRRARARAAAPARCDRWARRRPVRARPARATICAPARALTAASTRSSQGESDGDLFRGGPAGPGPATITNARSAAWRGWPQLAGKFSEGAAVYTRAADTRAPSDRASRAGMRPRVENTRR